MKDKESRILMHWDRVVHNKTTKKYSFYFYLDKNIKIGHCNKLNGV